MLDMTLGPAYPGSAATKVSSLRSAAAPLWLGLEDGVEHLWDEALLLDDRHGAIVPRHKC